MRVRILLVLSAALVLSGGVAKAARPSTDGQQVCLSYGGTYSTHLKSSFFAPFSKKQKVLWTCNGYSGGAAASQALIQACLNDGGQAPVALDSGVATCWKNAPL